MLIKRKNTIFAIIYILIALWVVLVPLRTVGYLISEFIICVNTYPLVKPGPAHKYIPKHLHQVFLFGMSSTLPYKLQQTQRSCIEKHPTYSYTLWNKTMVDELIDRHYPEIKDLYESYDSWTKRADVAMYLVLHHLGGWYIDINVDCKTSFDELSTVAKLKRVSAIVQETRPVGFSNSLIGISRRHPFLDNVINALHHSSQWYFLPYQSRTFSTGSMFLWGRYLNFQRKEEFYVIDSQAHYVEFPSGSPWYSLDSLVARMNIFRDSSDIWLIIACTCTFISVMMHVRTRKAV